MESKEEKKKMQDRLCYKGKIPPFFIMFKDFCYHGGKLSSGEFECWATLRSFCPGWRDDNSYVPVFPSRKTLSIMMGKTERQISYYLAGLRRKNLLRTLATHPDEPNYQCLHDPPEYWAKETRKKLEEAKILREKKRRENERVL